MPAEVQDLFAERLKKMGRILNIHHTFGHAPKLSKASAAMAFGLRYDTSVGRLWIELAIHNSETRLVLFTPDGHEARIGGHFNGSFACDDVEATYRQLSGRGVKFKFPPQKAGWGTFTIFEDDEGNEFVMGSR